jgi:hypothetical protein
MSTVTIPTAEAASITTGLNLPDTETPDEGVERILAAIRIMTPNNEGLSDEDVFSLAEVAQRAVSESTTLPDPVKVETRPLEIDGYTHVAEVNIDGVGTLTANYNRKRPAVGGWSFETDDENLPWTLYEGV